MNIDISKLPSLGRGDVLIVSGAVTDKSFSQLVEALRDIGYGFPDTKILVLDEGITLETMPRDQAIQILKKLAE